MRSDSKREKGRARAKRQVRFASDVARYVLILLFVEIELKLE